MLRVATESLALKYRQIVESLEKVTGRTFDVLNAGGGGVQNEFLVQATADAIGINVVTGPIEATSCGNIITQMVATGDLHDITAGRKLIATSMETKTYTPKSSGDWQEPYKRFQYLTKHQ